MRCKRSLGTSVNSTRSLFQIPRLCTIQEGVVRSWVNQARVLVTSSIGSRCTVSMSKLCTASSGTRPESERVRR